MRAHRFPIAVGLLVALTSATAYAGWGAGIAAGYMHIEIDDKADTYQVGPMVDYWADDAAWGFAAKALFSTYTFEFSEQIQVADQPVNLFATESDDNFRVDLDAAFRYIATDWLILLGGFRYELQDFDSGFDLTGDPILVAAAKSDPAVIALLRDTQDEFGRGFSVYSLALAATLFTTIGEGTTPYATVTIFPVAFVDSDIRVVEFQQELDGSIDVRSEKTDDAFGFGGFALEAGIDQAIPGVDGLSVGASARYQQMTIFGDDDLVLLDDEILVSILPYVHYSF